MDAVERSKVRGARDMLRECAKQLRSIDATGHAALADIHANQIDSLLPAHCKNGHGVDPGQGWQPSNIYEIA